MLRQKRYANKELMQKLKDALNDLLDQNKLTWGCIHKVDFKKEFDLPFGSLTAQKINKGHHVGKHTIMRGLEHFGIDYEIESGIIVTPLNEEQNGI